MIVENLVGVICIEKRHRCTAQGIEEKKLEQSPPVDVTTSFINQSITFPDLPNARGLVEIREIVDLNSVKTELSDIGTSNRSSLPVNHIDNSCGFIDSQSTGSDDTVVEAFTIMYMREKMLEISL